LENPRKMFAAISVSSAAIVLVVVVWAVTNHPTEPAFGQRFVMDEVPVFPWLGVYFKPVTIMVVFAFIAWACLLESLRGYAGRISFAVRWFLMILLCMVALVFAYEVIWNFTMWSDARILNPSEPVDLLYNNLNSSISLPRNFTYVTKIDFLYVAASLYSVLFLQTLRSEHASET
jgi:hypothetical protein